MIASFGKITFKVTEKEIKIFNDFSISRKARYAAHERINNKPLLQFMGLDADSISLNIQLVQGITGNVSDDLKSLQDMFKKAGVHPAFYVVCNFSFKASCNILESFNFLLSAISAIHLGIVTIFFTDLLKCFSAYSATLTEIILINTRDLS